MPNRPGPEETGIARGGSLRQVGAAFGEAVRLVRRHPAMYSLLFLALVLLNLSWKAFSLHQLEGWRLYLAANVVGYSIAFLQFCVLGLILALSVDRLRGVGRGWPGDALRRLGRMLPHGLTLYVLWDVVGGLIGYGLFQLADRFMDAGKSFWVMDATLFAGWLPGMAAAAVFGFALVGAAAGDRVSLPEARAMWREAPCPLVCTLLLWYAVLQIPYCEARFLFHMAWFEVIDPNWLYLVNKPFFTVLFGAVAAVWYVGLAERRAPAGQTGP